MQGFKKERQRERLNLCMKVNLFMYSCFRLLELEEKSCEYKVQRKKKRKRRQIEKQRQRRQRQRTEVLGQYLILCNPFHKYEIQFIHWTVEEEFCDKLQ